MPDFWTSMSHSTILTQTGEVPFEPFDWQRRLIDGDPEKVGPGRTDFEALTAENVREFYPGVSQKEMVLKSRDVGSSEIWVRWYAWMQLKFGGNILVKADKEDNGKNLLKMARHYLLSLPEGERPVLAKDNETELDVAGRGTIKAIVKRGGRSERCRYLLMTERAFWDNAEEELRAVSGALVAGGWEAIESTANGYNEYHALWVDGENAYRKVFAGRWDNPTHTDEWWQAKLSQQATDPEGLYQEYPATPEEAFISSSRGVFEAQAIRAAMKECKPPQDTSLNGALSIWVRPLVGRKYVIGADVAEGHDAGNKRLDASSAAVYEALTLRHVASLHERVPPEVFAEHLRDLGKLYGWAYLGVERNNHGHTVLLKLRELGYPDRALYKQRRREIKLTEQGRARTRDEVLGWDTTATTKPLMESDLGAAIKAQELASPDAAFWDEALSYVYLGSGKTGGMAGCHDDRVIAHMIAVQARKALLQRANEGGFVVGKFKIGEGRE